MSQAHGTCGTCKFFYSEQCRRHPPVALGMQQMNQLTQRAELGTVGAFAPTNPDWWCGDYEAALTIATLDGAAG